MTPCCYAKHLTCILSHCTFTRIFEVGNYPHVADKLIIWEVTCSRSQANEWF